MGRSEPSDPTVDAWLTQAALPFDPADPAALDAAVDRVVAGLHAEVELLGLGEALHGGEELLQLRNRLFGRLVTAHGYRAIAIESSFGRGWAADAWIAGASPESYAEMEERGISHGWGKLATTRELLEWMRGYNAVHPRSERLRFYGFDMPARAAGPDSPRATLAVALDFLAGIDPTEAETHRKRFEPLLGADESWLNPLAWRDAATAPERIATTAELRLATADLVSELRTRRPELMARDADSYGVALRHAELAAQYLQFFATLAGPHSFAGSLGVRDLLMADNLQFIADRERGRGKVLVFAHNSHLQRSMVELPTDVGTFHWWPAGAQLGAAMGERYAVIGSALGVSEANGIGQPEAGTLEARLLATPGPARFLATAGGVDLAAELSTLPLRSRGTRNPSYVAALSAASLEAFDWLVMLDAVSYSRGGPPLPEATLRTAQERTRH